MKRIIFDIETDGLLDSLTTVWCIVCRDVETGEVSTFGPREIEEGVAFLLSYDEIIGHNIIDFDIPALEQLNLIDHNRLLPKVTDTLVMARLIHTTIADNDRIRNTKSAYIPQRLVGSQSLKAWGYRLGILKGTYLEEHGYDHYCEEMLCYCVKYTEVTFQLYQSLVEEGWDAQSITLEHHFATIMQMMMSHGFSFDVKAATNLYVKLSQRKIELNDELQKMFIPDTFTMKSTFWQAGQDLFDTKKEALAAGHKAKDIVKGPNKTKAIPFNPGSRDHIADRLQRLGWKPAIFTEEGKPKVDEAVLSKIRLDHPSVNMLKEYLMLVKRMGQVAEGRQAWLTSEKGGRMYGRINTNGAVTGRCTHSRPNMAQVPRAGSPYGEECRALFKATEGATLIGCDASGLELRCLAHYLHPYDGGDYANKILQEDIHTVNQEAAGLPTRDAAKTFIYAFLYGAGDEKIGKVIGKGRSAGRAIKETFLQRLPALASLKACISNALSSREWLLGLDGRRLYIRSAHSALNSLLQGAGAIVMKQATVHLYEKLTDAGLEHGEDYGFVAHVHDEFQLEAKPKHVDLIIKESVNAIRRAGTTLGFKCPLDGEARAGSTWAETH